MTKTNKKTAQKTEKKATEKKYNRYSTARELLNSGLEPKEVISKMKKSKRESKPEQVAPTVYKVAKQLKNAA